MEKLSDHLNDKELEAVKELISKIPPEDLERAAGGVSNRTINILLAAGALAVTGVVTSVAIGRYSRSSTEKPASSAVTSIQGSSGKPNIGSIPPETSDNYGFCPNPAIYEEETSKDLVPKILKGKMDERALKALAEVVDGYRNVLKWETYFKKDSSKPNTYRLKEKFVMWKGKIYAKSLIKKNDKILHMSSTNWLYNEEYGGELAGVPTEQLEIPKNVICDMSDTKTVNFDDNTKNNS